VVGRKGGFVHWTCCALLLLSAVALFALDSPYTIREGETLFSIARKAQVPLDVLMAFNGITDAGRVKAGTVIAIPVVYAVKKGDTLYSIARAWSVPVGKLLEQNRLEQDARIKPGDRLVIPAGGQPAAAGSGATASAAASGASGGAPAHGAGGSAEPAQRLAGRLVLPHPGRREPEHGKMPGLVFFGSAGDAVCAASAGEVRWAATFWGRGKVIVIKAADGMLYTYGGNREILVNVGDRVSAGAQIARLGESPEGGGVKLFFSVQDASGHVVDPERLFAVKS
jgi:murein DD-endopeptidase MepM/ murein hydrolase activator NlpD